MITQYRAKRLPRLQKQ